MFSFLDDITLLPLLIAAIFMGLSPFFPEPHLIEKLRMLKNGLLVKPIDIFDLFFHLIPVFILILKLIRMHMLSK